MKYPKVGIDTTSVNDSHYIRRGSRWSANKLIEHSANYKVHKIPIAFIDLAVTPFKSDNFNDFVYHLNRVEKADLEYPILFDDEGCICDGWHRLAKAIVKGDTMIKAIRLEDMPPHDSYEKQN